MNRIDTYNAKISAMLTDFGIKHEVLKHSRGLTPDYLVIDRTSMVEVTGRGEDEAYPTVLKLVRELLSSEPVHAMWGGRTDEWLGVDVFENVKPSYVNRFDKDKDL